MSFNAVDLSKFLALVLRHKATDFGLQLDPEGFVTLDDLLAVLHRQSRWRSITRADLEQLVAEQTKKRYQIVGDDIRAYYGHSVSTTIEYPVVVPPAILLHGTPRRAVALIRAEGLRPMGRQYVHLTDDRQMAYKVGLRRDPNPVILQIDAEQAQADGVVFYDPGNAIFLTPHVPAKYISTIE